jgi:hypothetical protein
MRTRRAAAVARSAAAIGVLGTGITLWGLPPVPMPTPIPMHKPIVASGWHGPAPVAPDGGARTA